MKRYLRLWYLYSIYATQIGLQSRFGAILFFIGKFLRFGLYLLFIFILSSQIEEIAGYTFWQIIFVFATFNLIDVSAQILLREVYRFRNYVVSGDLDYYLIRPVSPLFRFLFGGGDILDLPMLLISILFLAVSILNIGDFSFFGIIFYLSLLLNAAAIALSFHIFILALGILTTEVDSTLWLYRDLTQMGRIPIDFYTQPIRSIITFVIPVGVMITFPAKAMFGQLPTQMAFMSFSIGFFALFLSYFFWKFALKRYSSTGS